MHRNLRATLVLGVALAAAGITTTAAQAGGPGGPPPPPPWANAVGNPHLNNPAATFEVSVVGADGQLVKDESGKVKKVQLRLGEKPPAPKAR